MGRHILKQHGEEYMNNEELLFEKYRQALQELQVARNHFEYCGAAYIDGAIDDLNHAEKALDRILKELRREKLDTPISKT